MNTSTFSLLGNPNCGKTAVFNLLTGLDQKVSNYPGITVEKKAASVKINSNLVTFEDYPGSYSLQPQSLDEKIVHDMVFSWMCGTKEKPNGIIYVADVTNLRRNLYFCSQLLMLDIPVILLLNMSDLAKPETIVDAHKLKKNLGVYDIIEFSASKSTGLDTLKESITNIISNDKDSVNHKTPTVSKENKKLLTPIIEVLDNNFPFSDTYNQNLS